MYLRVAVAGFLLAQIGGTARAENCASAATQSAMTACAGRSFEVADAALNGAYKKIRSRLKDNAPASMRLRAAQRAWLDFRDAECAFATSARSGGSVYPMLLAICRTALTQTRVQQLEAYLRCQEGDLSCPAP
ncbi:MAG: lysozyme inhibitor LprI family protein [Pseudomonadota bacterium]|nr:lysozyme inhibitor LprI family protein [Pseudomonadota bacterium]